MSIVSAERRLPVSRLSRAGGLAAAASLVLLAGGVSAARADEPAATPATSAPAAPAATAATDATDAKAVKLADHWVKGAKRKYELNIQRRVESSSATMPAADMVQTIDQRVGAILRLTDVSEQIAVFSLFITDINAKATIKDKEYLFDSSKPVAEDKGNDFAAAMRPLIGVTIRIVVNSDGVIVSSTGHHNAIVPGTFGLFAEEIISPDAIRRDWEPMLTMRRGTDVGTVSLGQEWQFVNDKEVPGMGVFTLTADSKFSDLVGNLATVKTNGVYTLKSEPGPDGTPVSTIEDSVYTGNFVWLLDDGFINAAQVDRKTVMVGRLQGVEIKISSQTTFVLSPRAEEAKPAAHTH